MKTTTLRTVQQVLDIAKQYPYCILEIFGEHQAPNAKVFYLESQELEEDDILEQYAYLYVYDSKENLIKDLEIMLNALDLYEGSDDRQFDYIPDTVSSIIYRIYCLDIREREELPYINQLLEILEEYVNDKDNWEELRDIYKAEIKSLRNQDFDYYQDLNDYIHN